MIGRGEDPDLPPLSPCLFEDPNLPIGQPLLVQWLLEVGPTEAAGMGAAPIGWATIDAWCARTGIDLEPWQARLLRRLSGDWLKEADRALDPASAPPWSSRPSEATRRSIERRLEALFDSLG